MITIKHLGEKYTIKNKLSELTINEYEDIQSLINLDDSEYFEKYIEVIIYLGVPREVANDMNVDNLLDFIKVLENTKIKGFKKTIELGGHKFSAIDSREKYPTITPRAIKLIEKAMKTNQYKNVAEILSILFKRVDIDDVEHYSPEHLKYKANLFRFHLTSDIALPYVVYVSQKILSNIKSIASNVE